MQIIDIIEKIKRYYRGTWTGKRINDTTSRDQVLFGNVNQECMGIIITCWATVDVIKKCKELGYNLIICHEALFWNHGDHTSWLEKEKNTVYLSKRALLTESNIVVWRNHDYIHSGIPIGDSYGDGIVYGVAKKLEWEKYFEGSCDIPAYFTIPKTTVKDVAKLLKNKLHLNGIRLVGNANHEVEKVCICMHIFGIEEDNKWISACNRDNYDLLIVGESVDFTLVEYIKDRSILTNDIAILFPGHFNLEEPGMEYMLAYLLDIIPENIPMQFISSQDMYSYIQ